jgi:BirA family biotin operon repressor/biotin-[acetyl-CoA-carboxylase] ligase
MACSGTDRLDPDEIKANLRTKRIGGKILVYRSTSSTNDVAAEYAKNKENDGLVIFAEEQTAGRGRAGSKWHGGRAQSILCSIVLTENIVHRHLLSLACAVAVVEAVGRPGKSHAKIKWPNDILLNGKKVAGILLESKTNHDNSSCIVGVGINCHQKPDSFPGELRPIATSIDIESRSIVDRISLAKRLLTSMDHWLEAAQKSSEKVIEKWCKLSIQLGHRTALIFNGTRFTGHCIGIDPEKGLILRLDTGGVRMFDAAHTTIVPAEDSGSQRSHVVYL